MRIGRLRRQRSRLHAGRQVRPTTRRKHRPAVRVWFQERLACPDSRVLRERSARSLRAPARRNRDEGLVVTAHGAVKQEDGRSFAMAGRTPAKSYR
jgi:hypothetical protein